jgi:hypothetical protein
MLHILLTLRAFLFSLLIIPFVSLRFAGVFYLMWFGDGQCIQVLLWDQVGNTSNQAISLSF